MAPTFRGGQVVIMRRFSRAPASLRRGDVVVFEMDGQRYIKRVYALAGDGLWGIDWPETEAPLDEIIDAINVERMRDVLRRCENLGEVVHLTVPAGHMFVIGDAMGRSYDSRHFGSIPVDAIRGVVVAALPPGDAAVHAGVRERMLGGHTSREVANRWWRDRRFALGDERE
jgi:signal peptidase I